MFVKSAWNCKHGRDPYLTLASSAQRSVREALLTVLELWKFDLQSGNSKGLSNQAQQFRTPAERDTGHLPSSKLQRSICTQQVNVSFDSLLRHHHCANHPVWTHHEGQRIIPNLICLERHIVSVHEHIWRVRNRL